MVKDNTTKENKTPRRRDNTTKENKTPRRRNLKSTKSHIRKNEEQKEDMKPKRKMSAKTYPDKASGEVAQRKTNVKEEDSTLKINEKKSKSNTPIVRSRNTSPPLQKLPPKPPAGKRVKKANNSKLVNNQDKNIKTNKKGKNDESPAKEPNKAKNADSAPTQQSANITDQFTMNNFISQSDSIKQNKNDSNILIENNNLITKLEITSQPSYKPSIFKPSRNNMNMEYAHEAFKSKKKSRTAFHISLNESTMSFLGNSSNGCLDMSSGLIVDQNQKRPDYNFHISIDDSSELNQSAAVIRNQIFNENNEWNFQETTPGRYDKIETESYNKAILDLQNYSDSLENSLTLELNESGLDTDNPSGLLNLPGTNPTSTRMSFLFNDNTGLLCKNCFSSECYHMENLSSVYQTKIKHEENVNRITPDENNNENSEAMIETTIDSTNNNNLIDSITAKAFYEKNNIDRPSSSGSNDAINRPSSSGSNVARDFDRQESTESGTQKDISIKHGNEVDSIDLLTSLNLKLKEILNLSNHIKIIKMDEVFHRNDTGMVVPFSEIEVELSNTLTEVLSENCDQSEADTKDNEVVDISHRSFKERLDHSESFRIDHLPEYNFDYSNNALRYTPTVGDNKYPKAVRRNSFMRENSNESKEILCYDSDYDDASYLNGCITNTQSSFEKLEIANNIFYANLAENKNEVAPAITPPLKCSSPTELVERPAVPKRKTSLRPMSSLFTVPEENNESSSMSVTPQSSSRQPTSNDHQPNSENDHLSDREKSPVQLNRQDSLNYENNNKSPTEITYLNENTQLTLSEAIDVTTNGMAIQQHSHLFSDSLNNSPCVPAEHTITDEMKNSTINENNIGYFMNRLEDESMLQDSINDITFRNLQQNQQPVTQASDDNLTTKELKALAREQLQLQHILDQGGTVDDLQISEEAKTTDIHGNELDSEDELQWFLQEKRKKILNSEFFSSDSSDVLPEDEEVRQINLPGRYQQKTDKIISDTVKNVTVDTQLEESTKTFTNKSTNTDPDLLQTYDRQNIDLEELGLYKHIDILVLNSNSAHASESSDISNPSGIDSGVDSRSSLTNRSLQNVQTENPIIQEDYSYNNDQRPYTEQDHRLFNEEQRLCTADLPFTSEGESVNNENYLMNHFLRQQSHFHNERQTNVSYYNQSNLGVNTEESVTQNTPLTEELRYINKDTPQRTPSALYRMNLRFLADKATPDIENLSRKSTSPSIKSKQSSLINKFSRIYSTPLKVNTVLATDKQTKFETFSPKPPPYTKKYKSNFNRNFNSASSTSRLIRQNEAKKSKIIETKLQLQRHVIKPGNSSSRSLPRISDYNGLVIQGHDIFKRKRKASATSRNLNHRKDNDAPVLTAPYRNIKQRQNMLL